MLWVDRAKEGTGERVASAHSEEQARRPDVGSHARPEIGDHQRYSYDGKQRRPRPRRGPNVGSVGVRKRFRGGPNELRYVNFRRREKTDYHASEHRREQNIAPWILGFFRKCGDAIETDIGENGNRSAAE